MHWHAIFLHCSCIICITPLLNMNTCRRTFLPSVCMSDRHPSFLSGPEAWIQPPSSSQAPLSPPAITNICVSSNGEQNFLQAGTKLWWRQFYICCCFFFTFHTLSFSLFSISFDLSSTAVLQFYDDLNSKFS